MILSVVLLLSATGCTEKQVPVCPVDKVDHSPFDAILQTCVNCNGMVDYKKLEQKYEGQLRSYLDYLSGIDVDKLPRKRQRLAFWINAYNALCLQQVLDLNPKRSAYLEDKLFFDRRNYFIAGRRRSLNEIQNQIIREQFSDPRVFGALCKASRSSPSLRAEAYRPETLAMQLDQQCRLWIANKKHNYLDIENNRLYLSAIFKNFAQDFDRLYDNPLGFYLKYTTDPVQKEYLLTHQPPRSDLRTQISQVPINYLPYDWSLNQLSSIGSADDR